MAPRKPTKIFTSQKPVFLNVSEVCEADGYLKFGIDPEAVEDCLGNIAKVMQLYKADVVVTAFGIAFFLIMRRFSFKLNSYLGFVHNYLFNGGDIKHNSAQVERMLGNLYKDHLTRFEKVWLNKGVRIK